MGIYLVHHAVELHQLGWNTSLQRFERCERSLHRLHGLARVLPLSDLGRG